MFAEFVDVVWGEVDSFGVGVVVDLCVGHVAVGGMGEFLEEVVAELFVLVADEEGEPGADEGGVGGLAAVEGQVLDGVEFWWHFIAGFAGDAHGVELVDVDDAGLSWGRGGGVGRACG
ncbi:hypothetical protein ACH4C6_35165 [Streptomyces sp. NPDC017943]|uniref:hypothetical protein n=1 Tax=Streptomyces sp. NPDC017943 TaxID=3365019 RepID=UPI0037898D46